MELKEKLIQKQEMMADYKKTVLERLDNAPEGRLKINYKKGGPQYYQVLGGKRIYLTKEDEDVARRLAQKSYDSKILKCVEKRLWQIGRILKDYEDDEIEKIYLKEIEARRNLVDPVEMTYEQMLKKWIEEPFNSKGFVNDAATILTNKGLRVRSKSEKIMADYFDSKGIAYKYECPLYLKSYGTVYPDFTFLSHQTGEEIYWEHEGMMDNEEYARKAVKKIESYEKSGIYPGEKLIMTFETSESVINMKLIEQMVERYIL